MTPCAASLDERRYDGGCDQRAEIQATKDWRYVCEESQRIRELFRQDPFQVIRDMQITFETRTNTPTCIDNFIDALTKTQCPLIVAALGEYAEWQAKDDL
jgi:hypothetical protein